MRRDECCQIEALFYLFIRVGLILNPTLTDLFESLLRLCLVITLDLFHDILSLVAFVNDEEDGALRAFP